MAAVRADGALLQVRRAPPARTPRRTNPRNGLRTRPPRPRLQKNGQAASFRGAIPRPPPLHRSPSVPPIPTVRRCPKAASLSPKQKPPSSRSKSQRLTHIELTVSCSGLRSPRTKGCSSPGRARRPEAFGCITPVSLWTCSSSMKMVSSSGSSSKCRRGTMCREGCAAPPRMCWRCVPDGPGITEFSRAPGPCSRALPPIEPWAPRFRHRKRLTGRCPRAFCSEIRPDGSFSGREPKALRKTSQASCAAAPPLEKTEPA